MAALLVAASGVTPEAACPSSALCTVLRVQGSRLNGGPRIDGRDLSDLTRFADFDLSSSSRATSFHRIRSSCSVWSQNSCADAGGTSG